MFNSQLFSYDVIFKPLFEIGTVMTANQTNFVLLAVINVLPVDYYILSFFLTPLERYLLLKLNRVTIHCILCLIHSYIKYHCFNGCHELKDPLFLVVNRLSLVRSFKLHLGRLGVFLLNIFYTQA